MLAALINRVVIRTILKRNHHLALYIDNASTGFNANAITFSLGLYSYNMRVIVDTFIGYSKPQHPIAQCSQLTEVDVPSHSL